MKRIISNILLFVVSLTFFAYVFVRVFYISVLTVCILFLIFALYGFCMGLGWKSIENLKKYEQKLIHFGLTKKDDVGVLISSLTTLMPTYFCVALVSLIPIYTYEIWFMTVFPCIILNCLPASSILSEYYGLTHKRFPFLILFFVFTIVFCFVGVLVSSLVLKKFIV